MGCVYKCVNSLNGKIYIGMTIGELDARKSQHISIARSKNEKLLGSFQKAIREHGKEKFIWSKEFVSNVPEELFAEESRLILYYKSNDFHIGYNLTHGSPSKSVFKEEKLNSFKAKALKENLDIYEFFLLKALEDINSPSCDFFISQAELHLKVFNWIDGLTCH